MSAQSRPAGAQPSSWLPEPFAAPITFASHVAADNVEGAEDRTMSYALECCVHSGLVGSDAYHVSDRRGVRHQAVL